MDDQNQQTEAESHAAAYECPLCGGGDQYVCQNEECQNHGRYLGCDLCIDILTKDRKCPWCGQPMHDRFTDWEAPNQ